MLVIKYQENKVNKLLIKENSGSSEFFGKRARKATQKKEKERKHRGADAMVDDDDASH